MAGSSCSTPRPRTCCPGLLIADELIQAWQGHGKECFICPTQLPEDLSEDSPDGADLKDWADCFGAEALIFGDDGQPQRI